MGWAILDLIFIVFAIYASIKLSKVVSKMWDKLNKALDKYLEEENE
jgi:hypothetical protein